MARRCPRCGELLWQRTFEGVTVDGCRSCGGTWFDARELERILQKPESLLAVEQAFPRGEQTIVQRRASNECPVCRRGLVPFRHPRFPSVTLDSCPICRGIWVDEGELATIHQALRPSPKPSEPDLTVTKDLPIVRGYHLPEIRPSSGFLDQFIRGVVFLKSALLLLKENPFFLTPIFLDIGAGIVLLALLGIGLWGLSGTTSWEAFTRWLGHSEIIVLFTALLWYVLVVFISFLFKGATVSMVDAYLKGRPVRLSLALRDALKNAGALAVLAIVTVAVDILVASLRRRTREDWVSGAVLGTLTEAIRILWEVVTFLVLPIIIVEDVGFLKAFRRGKDLYQRHLLPIVVGEVGIRFVAGALSFAVTFLAVGVVASLWQFGTVGVALGLAVVVPLVTFVYAVNAFVRAAYYTCLYLWAVEVEQARFPEKATVPAPLAAALAR